MAHNYVTKHVRYVLDALEALETAANSELTIDECHENVDVPWQTLFSRMGEIEVERFVDDIMTAAAPLHAYYQS